MPRYEMVWFNPAPNEATCEPVPSDWFQKARSYLEERDSVYTHPNRPVVIIDWDQRKVIGPNNVVINGG